MQCNFCLVSNFYFVNMDVKEKKQKEKKQKKIVKMYVCVSLYLFYECFIYLFFYLFMIKFQRLKKNLIFWLDHGRDLLNYT